MEDLKDLLPKFRLAIDRRRFLGELLAASAVVAAPRLADAEGWPRLAEPRPAAAAGAHSWELKPGPLLTRWAAQVDPRTPHPDYPRPQLVRRQWMNLNGVWEYQPGSAADEAAPFGKQLQGSILVPYPVESALSGVMEHHDRLWYRRSIAIPAEWRGKRILLHFGAVDYESEVFVNGKSVGVHHGGYDPFHYDITPFLGAHGDEELVVRVFDPTEAGGQPRGKQNTRPRGITYTPTTGIWQTVWLEPVNESCIESLNLVPDIDHERLNLTVLTSKPHGEVDVVVRSGDTVVTRTTVTPGKETAVAVPHPRLWSPDDPYLYTLELTLRQDNQSADSVSSYFGMRKTHVGDVNGEKKLLLNNHFLFQIGPLDQGFWPDGMYTPPTDEAMKNDILQMKAMGFNMVRKHIKVEPARWYYWTDKLGLMVWQDMPSANSYPGHAFVPPPVEKGEFEGELKRLVETHKNTPSIVLWTIFNEGQGQFDTGPLVDLVQHLDPSRPVNEASGGKITGAGNLNDIHSYPEPAVRPSNGRQAMVCGEYGGIGYLLADHSWSKQGRGYVQVDSAADLLYLYAEFMAWVKKMHDQNNLSAVVYTQLTDVENEVNGLLTYDRVAKVPAEQIKRVNTFRFPAPGYENVVPTSEQTPQTWKYVTAVPDDAWSSLDYDDSRWPLAPGGFGNHGDHIGTRWNTPEIWLRRHFDPGALTAAKIQNLVMTEFHQGATEIYINGMPTYSQRGTDRSFEGLYEHRPLPDAVRAAIRPNQQNVIAVHCRAHGPDQFFDAGLSVRIPSVTP